MLKADTFFQSELFGAIELDRHFSVGKAMAKGLATEFDASSHLDEARSFCCRVVHSYWNARVSEVGLDWEISPAPTVMTPLGDMAENLSIELGEAAAVFEPIKAGYLLGTIYTATLPSHVRSKWGAFYTPIAYVNQLLDMVEQARFDWEQGTIIDPACGGGAFLAPVALRMVAANENASAEFQLASIASRLKGVEVDPFAAWMSHVLLEAALLPLCAEANRRMPNVIYVADSLDLEDENVFDLVIGNPPYGRMKLAPERRTKFARSLFGHANLYGLFTDLAVRLAKPDGLIAYVTPTSFLGGQYFKALRQLLVREAPPVSISFVESREGVFDDVLQETLLAVYRKTSSAKQVAVTSLIPKQDGRSVVVHALGEVALNGNDAPWLLPRTLKQVQVFDRLILMSNRLRNVGYAINTGQLVWNRHKHQLRQSLGNKGVYPLIWAESVSADGFNFSAARRNHVPYIEVSDRQPHLLNCSACVLVQRTTAKEQARRLIAAVMPEEFIAKYGAVVVENHLNIVYAIGKSDIALATIAALLNSRAVDAVFRCLSGSVAVSAYELNALPLPDMRELRSLDRLVRTGADNGLIEKRLDRLYGLHL